MFLPTPLRLASRTFKSRTFFSQGIFRKFSSSSVRAHVSHTSSFSTSASKLGLAIGATTALAFHTHSKIFNDVAALNTPSINTNANHFGVIDPSKIENPTTSRFGGKLHYKQLSYGSLIGLVFGVVIGKLSSMLAFISLSVILTAQFLQTRGIIHVPWTSIVQVGRNRIDLRQLLLEDPSFKISFALTFLIAAFNV